MSMRNGWCTWAVWPAAHVPTSAYTLAPSGSTYVVRLTSGDVSTRQYAGMPAAAYCAGLVIRSVVTELGDTISTTSSTSLGSIGLVRCPTSDVRTMARSGVRYDGR